MISGDGIKSVMERMIEEMQTSDNIKKLVSDWFLDMVEETLFPVRCINILDVHYIIISTAIQSGNENLLQRFCK